MLEVSGKRVYGYNALTGELLRSADGGRTWKGTALPAILDLAIDPPTR